MERMKGETMTRLRPFTDDNVHLLFARFALGHAVDPEIKDLAQKARKVLEITNACRGESDPMIRVLIEESRREAVHICSIARKLQRGSLVCITKSCRCDYNEQIIRRYERMTVQLACALELSTC